MGIEIYKNCPVNPYQISTDTQPTPFGNLNYTNQDFWSLKTRLMKFCQERFGPSGSILPNSFNDFVESDLAIMLIENFAFIGDMLSFKIDQIVGEQGIDTVTQLDNAFRLAKLVGFDPLPPIAAASMWQATLPGVSPVDVQINTPVPVRLTSNNQPITIELFPADANNQPLLNSPIVIPAYSVINTSIIGLEGTTINSPFNGNGDVGQTLTLTGPVIYDSVQIQVDGKIWQQVESFTDSQPRQEYRVEFDSNWNAYVMFGNGVAGLIPSQGSQIQAQFRQGGGTLGNIVTGIATTQVMVSVIGVANMIPVTFTNYTSGQNGYDGDGIEDIRRKLPMWIATQDRVVSGSDYKTYADQYATPYNGQIGKSVAVLRNQGCAGNIIDLYILANNGGELQIANNNLKVDLLNSLNDVKMLTDFVCIKDGSVILVDIGITVTLNPFYKNYQDEINQNIVNATNAFFALNNWEYGQTLRAIDLIRALSGIVQVNSFAVTFHLPGSDTYTDEIDANFYEIIQPDPSIPISITFI